MRELFVYYKVRPSTAQAAHAAVVAMQQALCASHDLLTARLLRRKDATASTSETWMEIYASRLADDGRPGLEIDDALEAEIVQAALGLAPFIDGDRHVERFEALDRL